MYSIIISPLANTTYQENITYLAHTWSQKEVASFITKVSSIVAILKISPTTFQKWQYNTVIHKIEIVKQITLYYQIVGKEVHLLLFWNNLQDPISLLKHL